MLRHFEAEGFESVLSNGRTRPLVLLCREIGADRSVEPLVVKAIGLPEIHASRQLVSEVVGNATAHQMGVITPEPGIVWIGAHVRSSITPRSLPAQIEFEHSYKNGKWHVIEPLSFDYASPSDIKQRALLTFGKVAAAVKESDELGSVTVLVAKPRRVEAEKQFLEAMRLLNDLPVRSSRVVTEEDAAGFVSDLEAEMMSHGLLPGGVVDPETRDA